MSTFQTIALEDLLDTYIGGLWGEEPGRSDVDVKVMRITELGANGESDLSTSATRSLKLKQVASRKLLEGDLVLEKSGGGPKTPVGRVALIGSLAQDFICSNFMLLMRPNKSLVLSRYLHHFLTYLHVTGQTIPLQSSSTNIRNISTPDYMQIQVPVPPLDEQRRIVETLDDHLSRLDKAQAELLAANSKLDVFRRSAIEALTLGDETWTTSSLGDVTNVNWGDTTLTKSSYRNAGFTAFSASGPDGFIDKYDFDQDGVVLSAIGAACGKVFFATGKWSGIKNTICITPKDSAVSAKYLYYFLNDTNGWQKRGAAQPFIRQADARARKVRYPDLTKQQELIETLEAQITVFEILSKDLKKQVQQMMILRRSVLKMAFEGKL